MKGISSLRVVLSLSLLLVSLETGGWEDRRKGEGEGKEDLWEICLQITENGWEKIWLVQLMFLQQARVPNFGNWESVNYAPYTHHVHSAQKNKVGGKPIIPNDPEENPDAFSECKIDSEPEASKTKDQHRRSTDDHHRGTTRTSIGSERSIENSPLHPQYQAKSANKVGAGSPARERRAAPESGHVLGSGTPGRSRMKPTEQVHEIPQKGSMVPKFGAWDESDPSSADGFSDVFNKVREEKQSRTKEPMITTDPDFSTAFAVDRSENNKKSSFLSCFGCWKQ